MVDIKIGHISNYWTWNYDTSTIDVFLSLSSTNGRLILNVEKTHVKSGLGKGIFKSHIGTYDVGTIKRPEKGLIGKILKDNKQTKPFSRDGWTSFENKGMTLKELFTELYEGDNDISRSLKLSELKKRISKKIKK